MGKMSAAGGLTKGKLELATAVAGNVLSGKTFYAGDKNLKIGTMSNRGAWSGTYSGTDIVIPSGCHNGSGKVTVSGGNQGAKISTIPPGGSYTIPMGWHNGSGKITAGTDTPNITILNQSAGWGDGTIIDIYAGWPGRTNNLRMGFYWRADSDYNVNGYIRYLNNGAEVAADAFSKGSGYIERTFQQGTTGAGFHIQVRIDYHAGNGTFYIGGMTVGY